MPVARIPMKPIIRHMIDQLKGDGSKWSKGARAKAVDGSELSDYRDARVRRRSLDAALVYAVEEVQGTRNALRVYLWAKQVERYLEEYLPASSPYLEDFNDFDDTNHRAVMNMLRLALREHDDGPYSPVKKFEAAPTGVRPAGRRR